VTERRAGHRYCHCSYLLGHLPADALDAGGDQFDQALDEERSSTPSARTAAWMTVDRILRTAQLVGSILR
jgi:hypothetical protein